MWKNWGCQTLAGTHFRFWQNDLDGEHTSEALFDPYSFAHGAVGGFQFILIPPIWLDESDRYSS